MATNLGSLAVYLRADSSNFERGMASAEKTITRFAGMLQEVAAMVGVGLSLEAVKEWSFRTIDALDQIAKAAVRVGTSAEEFQKLKYAASMSGVGMEQLETGMKQMASKLDEAAQGNETAEKSFWRLGLAIGNLRNMTPDKQLSAITQALAGVKDPTERSALAVEIFGRAGTQLLPLAGQLDELKREAEEMGMVIDERLLKSAERAADGFERFKTKLTAFSADSGIIGFMEKLADSMNAIVTNADRMEHLKGLRPDDQKRLYDRGGWTTAAEFGANALTMPLRLFSGHNPFSDAAGSGTDIVNDLAGPRQVLRMDWSAEDRAAFAERQKRHDAGENVTPRAQKEADAAAAAAKVKAEMEAKAQKAAADADAKAQAYLQARLLGLDQEVKIQQLKNLGLDTEAARLRMIDEIERHTGKKLTDLQKAEIGKRVEALEQAKTSLPDPGRQVEQHVETALTRASMDATKMENQQRLDAVNHTAQERLAASSAEQVSLLKRIATAAEKKSPAAKSTQHYEPVEVVSAL